jgi:hypothetical protein
MRACVYMDVANFTHVGDPADGRRVRRADLGRALALPFCWGLEIVRAVAALPRFDPDGPGFIAYANAVGAAGWTVVEAPPGRDDGVLKDEIRGDLARFGPPAVVLLSGDGGYIPLVEALLAEGRWVAVLARGGTLNSAYERLRGRWGSRLAVLRADPWVEAEVGEAPRVRTAAIREWTRVWAGLVGPMAERIRADLEGRPAPSGWEELDRILANPRLSPFRSRMALMAWAMRALGIEGDLFRDEDGRPRAARPGEGPSGALRVRPAWPPTEDPDPVRDDLLWPDLTGEPLLWPSAEIRP